MYYTVYKPYLRKSRFQKLERKNERLQNEQQNSTSQYQLPYTSAAGITITWTNPSMRNDSYKTQEGIILKHTFIFSGMLHRVLRKLKQTGTVKFR